METTYIIHTYFEHCSVYYNDKNYTYEELKEILKRRGANYIKKNKEKKNPTLLENFNENFQKSNLSDEELKEFYISKKKSQFNYWKTKLRNLRKKGRLEKSKIDKLNEFGMLWNPKNDGWEIMYEKFKNKFIIDIIKNSFVEYGNHWGRLRELNDIEIWKNEQRDIFKKDKLSKENLSRLNFIKFPFEPEEEEQQELSIHRLILLYNYLKELNKELSSGLDNRIRFCNKYNLDKKYKNIGSKIKIKETAVVFTNKLRGKFIDKVQKKKSINSKKLVHRTSNNYNQRERRSIEVLEAKVFDDFKIEIDKISKIYIPTWNDINIYDSNTSKKERLELIYFKKYTQKYDNLEKYLSDKVFYSEKVNGITYQKELIFLYEDKIKEYASKKMIYILTNFLINTINPNYKKSYKPITFLLKLYTKENNIVELIELNNLIKKHQILSLIYAEKIKSIIRIVNSKIPKNISKDKLDDQSKKVESKNEKNDLLNNDELYALEQVKSKSLTDFKNEIDKISRKRGSKYWDSFTSFNSNRTELHKFLSNNYSVKAKKSREWIYINYEFDVEVKKYASEKIIIILDTKLLKTSRLNHKKSFKAISYLITQYSKEKNLKELLRISDFVDKHQILKLIYEKRIKKVVGKFR